MNSHSGNLNESSLLKRRKGLRTYDHFSNFYSLNTSEFDGIQSTTRERPNLSALKSFRRGSSYSFLPNHGSISPSSPQNSNLLSPNKNRSNNILSPDIFSNEGRSYSATRDFLGESSRYRASSPRTVSSTKRIMRDEELYPPSSSSYVGRKLDFQSSDSYPSDINIHKLQRSSSTPRIRTLLESVSQDSILSRSKTPVQRSTSLLRSSSSSNMREESIQMMNTKEVDRGLRGLSNIGNTCFMNSCVQCLSNISELRDYFLEYRHKRDINPNSEMRGQLAEDFHDLLCQLWKPLHRTSFGNPLQGTVVSPNQFKKTISRWAPQFTGTRQQDSQEFLRFLLDGLHEDLNRIRTKPQYEELKDIANETDYSKANRWWKNYCDRNSSFITDLFCGQLKSSIKCLRCKYVSSTFDPFMDISLPVPQDNCTSGLSLGHCIDKFVETEKLDEVYCSHCKTHRRVEKTLSFFRIPKVLVLHLKRFSKRNDKLLDEVNFGDVINLKHYMDPQSLRHLPQDSSTFTLSGVIKHMGGVRGGHYNASTKHADSGEWYCFNDSQVTKLQRHRCSSSDYILFYVKNG